MCDVRIHRGRHRATVIPESESSRKWILANVNGVEPSGMYMIDVEYLEDTVDWLRNNSFTVEVS